MNSSLSGLVNLLCPRCRSTRQGLEAQRNTLRATHSTMAGLSLQVGMAWCLRTILSLASNRKLSLTQHSNAPWHRRLQILSIQTSPTFFNTEPSSVPRVPNDNGSVLHQLLKTFGQHISQTLSFLHFYCILFSKQLISENRLKLSRKALT